MNIYAWIGLLGVVVLTPLQLLDKKNRTTDKIRETLLIIVVAIGIVLAVLVFNMNFVMAFLIGIILYILLDKKTYTKKRLIIYGLIVFTIVIAGFVIFRDNPAYVTKHLKNNPETTSLYVVENGVELIDYQADVTRPLASTVKIIIAAEYAMQVDEGEIDKNETVSLDELNRHYFKGTDGGAHEAWLDNMESEGEIKNNQVTLHDVAKGMITYSSNANTDYLIHLLGSNKINERIKELELTKHEKIYPIVAALLIPIYMEKGQEELSQKDIVKTLEDMPMDEYRSLAEEISNQLKEGTIEFEKDIKLSMDAQRVWSDRLIGASAQDYGKLVATISNDELSPTAADVLRDLMEWPMAYNEQNKERFTHLGMKGGSTAFVLTDAVYAETLEGDKTEIVLLTDNLNLWSGMILRINLNSFISRLIGNEEFQQDVQKQLTES